MPLIGAVALFARQDEASKRQIIKLIKDKKRAAQDTVAGAGKASYGKLWLGAGKVRDVAKEFTKGVADGAKEVKTTSAQQKRSLASTVGGALGGAGGGTVRLLNGGRKNTLSRLSDLRKKMSGDGTSSAVSATAQSTLLNPLGQVGQSFRAGFCPKIRNAVKKSRNGVKNQETE
jgi:hypothetical protein